MSGHILFGWTPAEAHQILGTVPEMTEAWGATVVSRRFCARRISKMSDRRKHSGWIGVDLDGTLALHDKWQGVQHIGEPIPAMVERVRGWLAEGREVRILTARVSHPEDADAARGHVEEWCIRHLGQRLPVTCIKDWEMHVLYDDRAIQVEKNTGRIIEDAK